MPRLIDADELGIGKANPSVFEKAEYAIGWNNAIEIIQNAPTIDAVPVVHGRWEIVKRKNIWDVETAVHECSVCKRFTVKNVGIMRTSNYCPNCGARMDGENDG